MPDDDVKERIREAVDIVEVIGERLPLKKAGKNFVTRCPFHNEKTPSFNVNPERQMYHCFGCNAGGDVFGFVMQYDKVSFPEALRTLAAKAGIQLTDQRSTKARAREQANDRYYEANTLAREYFVDSLNDARKGTAAREYLAGRGLTDETVHRFAIGYAPDTWDGFLSLARLKGIPNKVLVESGLVVQNEQGRLYDRFRGRVTFPITNQSGRIVAFGARTLDPKGEPKYLNSSESPVYQKSRILYGFSHARDAMRKESRVLIVEGYMDVITLMQWGVENVVATCGTALTREHGHLLQRYTDRIVLVFDGDEAGVRAAGRAGDVLLEAGIEASVALLPEGDDPDTFVASEGPDALRGMVENGTPYLTFKWKQLGEEHDLNSVTGRNRAISTMLDVIAPVDDEIARSLMAGQVADWGGVDETLVSRAIMKRRRKGSRKEPDTASNGNRRKRWMPPEPEKELAAWMLGRPWVCQTVSEIGLDCFTDSTLRELASILVRLTEEGETPTAARLLDEKPEDANWSATIAALSQISYDEDSMERAVTQLAISLQLPQVKRRMDRLRSLIRAQQDAAEVLRLSNEMKDLTLEYERLNAVLTKD